MAYSHVQRLELSWELWSHTTIATWWCSNEVTSDCLLLSYSGFLRAGQRNQRGKIHLPGHSHNIRLSRLLVRFSNNTKGWVACQQLEMPHLSPLLSGGWPPTPQALNKVEMTAMFGWKFLLILNSKSGTIHLQEWFLIILEFNVIICLFRKSYWF